MLTFVKQQDSSTSSIYLANGLMILDHISTHLAIAGLNLGELNLVLH